jgi:competence protein ComEC
LSLVAIPAMAVTQVAGMVVALPLPGSLIQDAAGWSAHAGAYVLVASAALVEVAPWLAARVPPPPWWLVGVYYLVWFGLRAQRRSAKAAATIGWILTTALIVSGTASLPRHDDRKQLRLTVFDVGQGDGMLLEAPDGPTLMVDTGGMPFGGSGFDIGSRVLEPALWARGVRSVSAMLLTHGDPDHAGGAPTLLADFGIEELWEGIPVRRNATLRQIHAIAHQFHVAPRTLHAGQQQRFGDATIRVLHPEKPDWERQKVRNDDSVVIEVRYGDVALLLTGDIGADVERQILSKLSPARIRILKVAHHGSRTSSSAALLEAWRPHIAVISCGRGNRFGHPAPEVVERLAAIGARVYRTDRDGEITLSTDGRTVNAKTFVGGDIGP